MLQDPAIRIDPSLPAPLRQALLQALQGPPQRVRRIAAGGHAVWLKQTEQLSLRWRLQKGDSRRAFEADRAALQDLSAPGMPVPRLVASGPEFFATAEAGAPISGLLQRGDTPSEVLLPALEAAGAALGRLHAAGVVHGRPKLRDICWDGRRALLIDFERYQRGQTAPALIAQDMLVLLHSLFTIRPQGEDGARAALRGWQAQVGAELPRLLSLRARRLFWLRGLAQLVLKLRPKSRETRALPITLDWITKTLGGDSRG